MNKFVRSFLLASSLIASSTAWSVPYNEVGDAGESLATAQMLGAGVDIVYGSYELNTADIYGFAWSGGAFSVDTFGSVVDPQLFLFNSSGQGVWASDGTVGYGPGPAQIVDPSLAAGLYFLAISPFDYDPASATGPMFPFDFVGQFAALDTSTLTHWTKFHLSSPGNYIINFRTPTSVPEPSAVALFSAALTALAVAILRRKPRR